MLNKISISVDAFSNPALEVDNDTWIVVNEFRNWHLEFLYSLWRTGM